MIEKNIKDSAKDGLIRTSTTIAKFFVMKVAIVKLPGALLLAMDIIKYAGGICGGILVKVNGSNWLDCSWA